jgi:N-acetylneuraminate synthase
MEQSRRCYLVAALEDNHQGSLALAQRMVDAVASSGADAVKVPRRRVRECYSADVLAQPYHAYPELGSTYGKVLEALELKLGDLRILREHCRDRVHFIAAPYDLRSLEELDEVAPDAYQVDPPVLAYPPLLEGIRARKKPVLAALGICSDEEVDALVETLRECPLTLLHCVAAAPLPLEETRLGALEHLRRRYGLPVGYLGADEGSSAALVAYALGATVVEKPFTLDRALRGPSQGASMDQGQWRSLVTEMRALERSLRPLEGRRVLDVEMEAFTNLRVSLVAAKDLQAGTPLRPDLVTARAPLRGLSPRLLPRLLGKRLLYDLPQGAPITFGMVEP